MYIQHIKILVHYADRKTISIVAINDKEVGKIR